MGKVFKWVFKDWSRSDSGVLKLYGCALCMFDSSGWFPVIHVPTSRTEPFYLNVVRLLQAQVRYTLYTVHGSTGQREDKGQ